MVPVNKPVAFSPDWSSELITESMYPKNMEIIKDPDGSATVTGPCGDTMSFYLRFEDRTITTACFHTDGCAITRACGSAATQIVQGMNVIDAFNLRPETIDRNLGGLPLDHKHCATLCITTLRCAIANYARKSGWTDLEE